MSDLIERQKAIDAIHCDITVTGKQNAELVASTIGAFVDRIKALPPAQLEERTETHAETHACDLISRQEAIDAIDKAQNSLHNAFAIGLLESKKIITELPSTQPEQKWIPVSERLPELDEDGYSQKVLACYGNYSGCDILEYRATEGIGKWYIGDMDESPEDIGVIVSAWMPLPEPYKGEQGEK